jgi:predicted kinase
VRERARELDARAQLVYLDVPTDVLWERLEVRNVERPAGTAVISRENLLSWVDLFEAPDAEEQSLFDDSP